MGGTTCSASGDKMRVISYMLTMRMQKRLPYTWRNPLFGPKERLQGKRGRAEQELLMYHGIQISN